MIRHPSISALLVLLPAWMAAAQTTRPLAFLEDQAAWGRVQGLIDAKAEKAAAVLDFIHSERRYPTPANAVGFRPGTDVQRGQKELEGLTAEAIDAHNALEAALLELTAAAVLVDWRATDVPLPAQFGNETMPPGFDPDRLPKGDRTYIDGPTSRPAYAGTVARPPRATAAKVDTPDGEPTTIVLYAIIDSSPAWNDWLRRIGTGQVKGEATRLWDALAALGRSDHAAAQKLSEKLQGRHLWFFDLMARHAIQAYNARERAGESRPNPAELEVIESINAYRLALDLVPWVVDARLQRAAVQHSEYQVKTGRIGHEQDDRRLRHSWQRAQRQGYPATDLSEIISNGLGPWAVWGWRGDAAHHRSLVRDGPRACGVGIAGPYVTCESASHDDSPFAKLVRLRPPTLRVELPPASRPTSSTSRGVAPGALAPR